VGTYKSTSLNKVVDTDTELKIVYQVRYEINTNDNDIKNQIKAKVLEFGGKISSSYETDTYSNIQYKVPVNKLDSFLDYVDTFNGIGSKEISSDDITSSYNEVEARIDVLEACLPQYTALLGSDGITVSDRISIQKEINDINTELESLYKTKDSYDDEVNYSKVTIKYYLETEEDETNFFTEYFENLLTIFTGLGIALLYIIPVGGPIVAIVFGVKAIIKKIKKDKLNKKE